jgi:23S rRNA pseudouridine2605 synthase
MPDRRRRTQRRSSQADPGVRLQKILADAGIASRRAAEELISAGRVSVNGKRVTVLGTRADPARDRIAVDGRTVGRPRQRMYWLVNKPRGVVTTTRDPHAKRTVLDLVPSRERLFPVGRLDAQSEGLLLVTNDGALAQILLHPSFGVPRTYRVSVNGAVSAETVAALAAGIELEGRRTAPCQAEIVERERERSVLMLELTEGRRRQIRLALESLGHPVRRLLRVRFGPLRLGRLPPGEARKLTKREVSALHELADAAQASATGSPRRKSPTRKDS